jgi:hypothetical protein
MKVIEIPACRLDEYSLIPITFDVTKVFEVSLIKNGLDGIQFNEKEVPLISY